MTRDVDTHMYLITYNEFARLLHRYGYALENPTGNEIDVVRVTEERYGIFQRGTRTVHKRVSRMGFPRWSAQVDRKDLKRVLREIGLTPSNGYDSKVVFKDADPLDALIDTYRGPLRRLKDK